MHTSYALKTLLFALKGNCMPCQVPRVPKVWQKYSSTIFEVEGLNKTIIPLTLVGMRCTSGIIV